MVSHAMARAMVDNEHPDADDEWRFAPLDDYGPNDGCVQIKYLGDDGVSWETL